MEMISRLFLSEDQLAAIGSIAVESSYLESSIDEIICRIAHFDDDLASVFMPNAMMGHKITIIKSLAARSLKTKKKKLSQFTQLMEKVASINSERVAAVHGLWEPPPSRPSGMMAFFNNLPPDWQATAKNPRKQNAQPLQAARLEHIAAEISKLHLVLHYFALKEWPALKTRAKSQLKSKISHRSQ